MRSAAELAFSVMRVLAIAQLLWPRRDALTVERLAAIAGAPAEEVEGAIALLCAEGVACRDDGGGGVHLCERAVGEWLRSPRRRAPAAAAELGPPG